MLCRRPATGLLIISSLCGNGNLDTGRDVAVESSDGKALVFCFLYAGKCVGL